MVLIVAKYFVVFFTMEKSGKIFNFNLKMIVFIVHLDMRRLWKT